MATTFGCCASSTIRSSGMSSSSCALCGCVPTEQYTFVETLGDGAHLIELTDAGRDGDQRADAGLMRPRHDLIELRREFGEIEMAMVIDQHQAFLLFCLACPPCGALSASAGST